MACLCPSPRNSTTVATTDGRSATKCYDCGGVSGDESLFSDFSEDPPCPECGAAIDTYDDHRTGCPKWGMRPGDWRT